MPKSQAKPIRPRAAPGKVLAERTRSGRPVGALRCGLCGTLEPLHGADLRRWTTSRRHGIVHGGCLRAWRRGR